MINLTVLFEVIMFGRRYVSVELGDIFVEDLPGKKSMFRAMGVAETTPSERFLSYWKVEELVVFNGLPHAQLTHSESGRKRVIARHALERQGIYKKQN